MRLLEIRTSTVHEIDNGFDLGTARGGIDMRRPLDVHLEAINNHQTIKSNEPETCHIRGTGRGESERTARSIAASGICSEARQSTSAVTGLRAPPHDPVRPALTAASIWVTDVANVNTAAAHRRGGARRGWGPSDARPNGSTARAPFSRPGTTTKPFDLAVDGPGLFRVAPYRGQRDRLRRVLYTRRPATSSPAQQNAVRIHPAPRSPPNRSRTASRSTAQAARRPGHRIRRRLDRAPIANVAVKGSPPPSTAPRTASGRRRGAVLVGRRRLVTASTSRRRERCTGRPERDDRRGRCSRQHYRSRCGLARTLSEPSWPRTGRRRHVPRDTELGGREPARAGRTLRRDARPRLTRKLERGPGAVTRRHAAGAARYRCRGTRD